jgi:hypothetical protein
MSNWEKIDSTTHPLRKYYLNTSTQVSQWGIPEGEIPLPPDWERHRSRQFNKIYYENLKTSQTQWEPPFGRILPFILFGDDPDPYYVLNNLDSNWKYGIFITPIFTDEEVYIKKLIQDPYPWGELHISCTQFIAMNSEKAKLCLQKILSIDNQEVKSVEIQTLAGSNGSRKNHVLVTNYKPSPNVNSLFDYFSDSDTALIKLAQRATLEYGVDPEKIDDTNYEYALEELKKTEWEYSFIARLDEKEKNTRSLIFISKTLGIRAYVRNIN